MKNFFFHNLKQSSVESHFNTAQIIVKHIAYSVISIVILKQAFYAEVSTQCYSVFYTTTISFKDAISKKVPAIKFLKRVV